MAQSQADNYLSLHEPDAQPNAEISFPNNQRSDLRRSLSRIFLIALVTTCAAWLQSPSIGANQDTTSSRPDSATKNARLVALGKLWANAGLFHPYLAHTKVDWDAAFVEA